MKLFKQISAVKFTAHSHGTSSTQWNCRYHGSCAIKIRGNAICLTDYLTTATGKIIVDYKVWKIVDDEKIIEFWHYRRGNFQHVFSFSWPELGLLNDYICGNDCYRAALEILPDQLVFTIWINSARKNEELTYIYS